MRVTRVLPLLHTGMQKLGETMAAGCGFTIEDLRHAEQVFAAKGAQVSACPSPPLPTHILTHFAPLPPPAAVRGD